MDKLMLIMIIAALCLPGIAAMGFATVRMLAGKPDNTMSSGAIFASSAVPTLAIVLAGAAAGVYWGPKVGIRDAFLEGLAQGDWLWANLLDQLGAGALSGTLCALGWLAAYYGYVRKRLDSETLRVTESLRNQTGLWTRLTSGGIVEEVIFRWGLMVALAWGLSWLSLSQSASLGIALLVSGFVFGLAHLPGNLQEGAKPTPLFVWAAILGNLWVSLFCGYVLYQYGLFSAMVVHILFHVWWYPLDTVFYRKLQSAEGMKG
ncbi:CPBP family intramembrane glutamic endopeptidase [Paenibacillaceae bacterium WGS1546]|uniref:CPBP family intramembrane glutamic endopeptidase n=1 Tax=Cohnella sp. WGS1546 TaxID=3366810 RepID=UPI00372D6FD0